MVFSRHADFNGCYRTIWDDKSRYLCVSVGNLTPTNDMHLYYFPKRRFSKKKKKKKKKKRHYKAKIRACFASVSVSLQSRDWLYMGVLFSN